MTNRKEKLSKRLRDTSFDIQMETELRSSAKEYESEAPEFISSDLQNDNLVRDALGFASSENEDEAEHQILWQVKINDFNDQIPWRSAFAEPHLPTLSYLLVDDRGGWCGWMMADMKDKLHYIARTCEEIVAYHSKIIQAFIARADKTQRMEVEDCRK